MLRGHGRSSARLRLIHGELLHAVVGTGLPMVLARQPALEMRATMVGFAVTAAAILVLLPTFGPRGAAFGTLVGEVTLLVGYALNRPRSPA